MKIFRILMSCLVLPLAQIPGYSQTQIDLRTQGKGVDFSAALSTKPSKTGTVLPATCSIGETFFKTDAPAGQNLYGCTAPNVWSLLSSTAGGVTSVGISMPAEFSVTGSPVTGSGTLTVSKSSQSGNSVYAGPSGGGAAAPAFRSLVSDDIPDLSGTYQARTERNAANGYAGLSASGKLAASQGQEVWSIADLSNVTAARGNSTTVQMTTGTATTDHCAKFDADGNLVDAGAACGTGGGGGVTSFEGRTGGVTSAAGDYTASEIANTPAGNIAATTVQAAINELDTEKAAAGHSHTLAGDVTGDVGSAVVTKLQGRAVASTAPAASQALVWNSGASQWQPASIGGAGPPNYSQSFTSQTSVTLTHGLGTENVIVACYDGSKIALQWNSLQVVNADSATVTFSTAQSGTCIVNGYRGSGGTASFNQLEATRTSGTALTLNPNCSTSAPCNIKGYQFTSSCTVTLSGSNTGQAWIGLDATGSVNARHNITDTNVTVSGSGCAKTPSSTGFLGTDVPAYNWPITSGTWDASQATFDKRSFLTGKEVAAGTGIAVSDIYGKATVSVDSAALWIRVAVPAASGSACNAGEVAQDSSYAYFCVATNTWKRSALSSW